MPQPRNPRSKTATVAAVAFFFMSPQDGMDISP